MTTNPQRQPKGTPTGGQFSASARFEADVSLDDFEPMAAAEFGTFCESTGALRRLEPGERHTLPDGATVTVDGDAPAGLVESGEYTVTGQGGDHIGVAAFRNMTERARQADEIAKTAVLNARRQEPTVAEDEEYEHPVFGKVIHSYTRAAALRDGVLRDYSAMGREAGFSIPVAVTDHVYADAIAWGDDEEAYQDEEGRAWDVIYMASMAARRARPGTSRIEYRIDRIPPGGSVARTTTLVAVVGPGDDAEPVLTIMYPGDD